MPELIKDGESGFLSEVGDVEKMTKDTLKLLSDSNKLAHFRANARKRAVDEFSSDKIVDQYVELYRSLIDNA